MKVGDLEAEGGEIDLLYGDAGLSADGGKQLLELFQALAVGGTARRSFAG